jgi:hypothetical protein
MWIPQVVFCIATQCWLVQAQPVDTRDDCEDFIYAAMLPALSVRLPSEAVIRLARCHQTGTLL